MIDFFESAGGPPDTDAIRARLIAAHRALLDIRGATGAEQLPALNAVLASLRDLGEHVDTVDALRTALRSAVHALDTAAIWLDRPGLHEGTRGAESAAAAARAALGDFAKPVPTPPDARAEDRNGGGPCAAPTVRAKVAAARLRWAAMCAIQVEDVPHMNGDEDAGRRIGDEDCEGEPEPPRDPRCPKCGAEVHFGIGTDAVGFGGCSESGKYGEMSTKPPGWTPTCDWQGPVYRWPDGSIRTVAPRDGDEDDGAPDAAGESGGVR